MALIPIMIQGYRCERCGHEWFPKDRSVDAAKRLPTVCPKCKSPYWNRPRKQTGSPKKTR